MNVEFGQDEDESKHGLTADTGRVLTSYLLAALYNAYAAKYKPGARRQSAWQ
jgi:hypothetical protein